ncbi:MAG: 50S ribosomal protein L21 [Solitalea-like symbiont of Acarus siro]
MQTYAVVSIQGKQFIVEEGINIEVPYIKNTKEGSEMSFDEVLLYSNGEEVKVGQPIISGAKIGAKVLLHGSKDKILVFKKKRRKGYKKTIGHKEQYTKLSISNITIG